MVRSSPIFGFFLEFGLAARKEPATDSLGLRLSMLEVRGICSGSAARTGYPEPGQIAYKLMKSKV